MVQHSYVMCSDSLDHVTPLCVFFVLHTMRAFLRERGQMRWREERWEGGREKGREGECLFGLGTHGHVNNIQTHVYE